MMLNIGNYFSLSAPLNLALETLPLKKRLIPTSRA